MIYPFNLVLIVVDFYHFLFDFDVSFCKIEPEVDSLPHPKWILNFYLIFFFPLFQKDL